MSQNIRNLFQKSPNGFYYILLILLNKHNSFHKLTEQSFIGFAIITTKDTYMNNQSKNLKILDCNYKKEKCLVCFSSNMPGEKYEFENICSSKKIRTFFNKIIFLRDPKFSFYINGIDENLNTADKVIDLIIKITQGLDVYCIGYSSGAYMSMILGCLHQNVKRVFNFGGIINILDWHGAYHNYDYRDLEVVKNATNKQKKFFNIETLLTNSSTRIYSFYAANCQADVSILESLDRLNLSNNQIIKFDTCKHGDYCLPFDYKLLFLKTDKQLDVLFSKFKNRTISPIKFSFALQGPFKLFISFITKWISGIRRRLHRKKSK